MRRRWWNVGRLRWECQEWLRAHRALITVELREPIPGGYDVRTFGDLIAPF